MAIRQILAQFFNRLFGRDGGPAVEPANDAEQGQDVQPAEPVEAVAG